MRPRLSCRPPGWVGGGVALVSSFTFPGRGLSAFMKLPSGSSLVSPPSSSQFSLPLTGPRGRSGTAGLQQHLSLEAASSRISRGCQHRSSWPSGVSPAQVPEFRQSSTRVRPSRPGARPPTFVFSRDAASRAFGCRGPAAALPLPDPSAARPPGGCCPGRSQTTWGRGCQAGCVALQGQA